MEIEKGQEEKGDKQIQRVGGKWRETNTEGRREMERNKQRGSEGNGEKQIERVG